MFCMNCNRHIDERCIECSEYHHKYDHAHNLAKAIELTRSRKKASERKVDLSDADWQFIINILKEV